MYFKKIYSFLYSVLTIFYLSQLIYLDSDISGLGIQGPTQDSAGGGLKSPKSGKISSIQKLNEGFE